MSQTDQQLLDLTVATDCFKDLDATEKAKVQKAIDGLPASTPRSNIAKVAFYLARRIHPVKPAPPPPPPPPPPAHVAPRTYNEAPGGEPSARFCVTGLSRNANGRLADDFSEYDDDGHDLGGRTDLHVDGLKYANEMDGRGPCDPYGSFPPWPAGSYER